MCLMEQNLKIYVEKIIAMKSNDFDVSRVNKIDIQIVTIFL